MLTRHRDLHRGQQHHLQQPASCAASAVCHAAISVLRSLLACHKCGPGRHWQQRQLHQAAALPHLRCCCEVLLGVAAPEGCSRLQHLLLRCRHLAVVAALMGRAQVATSCGQKAGNTTLGDSWVGCLSILTCILLSVGKHHKHAWHHCMCFLPAGCF